ncbi:MAG: hypothetical protein QXP98_01495 [Thermoproteus sp.]
MWRGPATQIGEEELGADSLHDSSQGKRSFRKLVVGPPREALEVARRIGGVAVSDFSDVDPREYEDVYVVHARDAALLEPLLAGAEVVLYIKWSVPPPRGVRVVVLTCAKDELCEEADCLCGGALRI